MDHYYSAICGFCTATLAILSLLVRENGRLTRRQKNRFYQTYAVFFLAILMEWLGLALNGAPAAFRGVHLAVKCLDYCITPVAGIFFAAQVVENEVLDRPLLGVLGFNALLQIASIFTGWTFYLDESNVYHHGPLYIVYMVVYVAAMVTVLWNFARYGLRFQRSNRGSLIAVLLMCFSGIVVQEFFNLHTWYPCMVLCSMLLFVHYMEFSQMVSDTALSYQRQLLERDVLTGLYSRYAYTEALKLLEAQPDTARDLVVLSLDINDLKTTNDNLGHLAGDELIKGAADCMAEVLNPYGKCYRTGGDEFIALLTVDPQRIPELFAALRRRTAAWHGTLVNEVHLSMGAAVASRHPGLAMDKLIALADQEMYADKEQYYLIAGKTRRSH